MPIDLYYITNAAHRQNLTSAWPSLTLIAPSPCARSSRLRAIPVMVGTGPNREGGGPFNRAEGRLPAGGTPQVCDRQRGMKDPGRALGVVSG